MSVHFDDEEIILSLITIPFKPNLDIRNGESIAGCLWTSALEYVRSCPGCQAVFWASTANSPHIVNIIITWIDDNAYREFQESLGFGVAAGFFSGQLQNRHMSISQTQLGGDGLVTYIWEYCYDVKMGEERKTQLSGAWLEATRLKVEAVDCDGNWLRSEPVYRKFSSENDSTSKFVGVVVLNLNQQLLFDESKVGPPLISPTHQSFRALEFQRSEPKNIATSAAIQPGLKIPSPRSLAELLLLSPIAQFTLQPERGCEGRYDHAWDPRWDDTQRCAEREAVTERIRLPTPRGGYQCMGDLTTSISDSRPNFPKNAIDIVRLSFRSGICLGFEDAAYWKCDTEKASQEDHLASVTIDDDQSSEDIPAEIAFHWSDLRSRLMETSGCYMLIYGICQELPETVELLICWRNPSERSEGFQRIFEQEMIKNLTPYFEKAPTFTRISSIEIKSCARYKAEEEGQRVEMVKFFVLPTTSRDTFEYYFTLFYSSFFVQNPIRGGAHVSSAGSPWRGGWQDDGELYRGQEAHVFITLIEWESKEAEYEWYEDFRRESMKSYERLGYRLEGLKAVVVGIESFHYDFKVHDKQGETEFEKEGGVLF